MENQSSTETPAAATEEAVATKNGGNATQQEVSSTTQTVEPTKRSLRVQTWKKMRDNKCGIHFNAIFNRIPIFVNCDEAAALLIETDEFKKAKDIKVQIDRALYTAKLQTILAGKNLYLPSKRDSKALYLKVEVPANATPEQKAEILNVQSIEKHRTEISLEDKVIELDMVIIGSVVVSRDGYRIGRGYGFNDLDIGLLIEIGSITNKTIIATMVHDTQVVDNLPINLFQKYDTPVDLIITPSEVIRVAKRLPRPSGIYWELLSERRLKLVPVLQVLKETQEKAGKIIVLKEVDTDIEQNYRSRRRFIIRRRFAGNRRFRRRTVSQNNPDQQHSGDNSGQQQQKRNPQRRRRFNNRRRRPTRSEGDQSGVESKSQDRRSGGEIRKLRPRRNRPTREFSVRVSNISRDVHIRDLKSELRNRQCKPLGITWKIQYGRCYLHFGNRSGGPCSEDDMNKVLEALNNLSLTITPNSYKPRAAATDSEGGAAGDGAEQRTGAPVPAKPSKVVNLKVELIKYREKRYISSGSQNDAGANGTVNCDGDPVDGGDANSTRIESVDTTTV